MSINETERKQDEFDAVINALGRYSPRDQKFMEANNKLLDNVKKNLQGKRKNY